jgi:hypothetical protein
MERAGGRAAAATSGAIGNLDADLGVAWDLSAGTQPWDT